MRRSRVRRGALSPVAWPALVAVALLALAGTAFAQDGRDADRLLRDGMRAFEREQFAQARADLWAYLDATASLSGPARLPQAEALYTIALMEPDASIAAQHYQIIVDEFAAASVADQALFRLALFDLVEGRPAQARERLERLRQNYPFSRTLAELPLWIGRTHLDEGQFDPAIQSFLQGLTMVKSGDLPQEMPMAQREALAAEYAWWLATAYREEGDERTATQYYTLLTLDYPGSPQAAEAQVALGGAPAGAVAAAPELPPAVEEPVREEPVDEEPAYEEPAREEPVAVEPAPRQEPAVVQPIRPAPADAAAGIYYLQIGAFTSASNAADLSSRLKGDGFASSVEVAVVDGRGYYRVRLGPYQLPEEIGRFQANAERLAQMGYPAQRVPARQ